MTDDNEIVVMSFIHYRLRRLHHTKLVLEVFCSTCDNICSFLNYKQHDSVAFWTRNKEKILCPNCTMACENIIYRRVFGRKDIPIHRSILRPSDDDVSLKDDSDNKMIHPKLFCSKKKEDSELKQEYPRPTKCDCGARDCPFLLYKPINKMYVKVTNEEENHNGYQYHDGLNILDKPFEVSGSCVPGGLYFTTVEYIHQFYNYGINIRIVKMPVDYPDFKAVRDPGGDKWRANMIILEEKYSLLEPETYHKLGLTRYHPMIANMSYWDDRFLNRNDPTYAKIFKDCRNDNLFNGKHDDEILSKWLNPKTYTDLNLPYPKFIYELITSSWPHPKFIADIIDKIGRKDFYSQWHKLLGTPDDDNISE